MLGRCIHPAKRGFIPQTTPALLQRLGIDHETFIAHGTQLLKEFGCAVGKSESLIALAAERQARYLRGMHTANALFGKAA